MRYVDTLVKILLVLLLVGLLGVVTVQVYARFLLPKAPSWTEELARIFLLFLVALGSGLALRNGMFISVELLHMVFHTRCAHLLLQALGHIVTAASSAVLLVYSIQMVKTGAQQTSPALLLPMQLVFASMTLLPLNILVAQCYLLWNYLRKRRNPSWR